MEVCTSENASSVLKISEKCFATALGNSLIASWSYVS